MGKLIKLRKGKDILLVGEPVLEMAAPVSVRSFAIKPSDFKGIVPKMLVKVGDEVKAGSPLFHSKTNEQLIFSSPVSGEIAEIVRGDRRVILEIRILADAENKYVSFAVQDPKGLAKDEIAERIKTSGAWPLIRQRPFNIVADILDTPKSIFISTFDSAPLAPDYGFLLKDDKANLQAGIDALAKLTSGKVYLGLKHNGANNTTFTGLSGAEHYEVAGQHPAGNVGVQIHHMDPVNKGDVVWVVNPQDLAIIGRLFTEGKFRNEKTIALTGSQFKTPNYISVFSGANLATILADKVNGDNNRVISGNVLTGSTISQDGFLGYYDNQITIIPEGNEYEFMGWLIPTYPRPSISKSFLYYLNPKKKFVVNTNNHGEERAFVVSGEYEKVLPMDILPVQLLKSILAKDFEAMENLGIYEVVEEDFALCEFVCTSKMDVQEILKEGLELVEREG
jgi:Na+-transporting NADH:ubiquinone oxidoreductase subunit A